MSEWKEVRFDEIGDVFSGGTPSTTNPELWDGDIAFVTPYDLSKTKTPYIKKTQRYITKKGLEQSSANLLPADSLIISSRAPIGYIALSETEFVTNQGCKSLRFFENQEPLFHYYNLQLYVDLMKRYGVGTTFAEISKGDLAKQKINIPKDKSIQKKIAQILTTCDTVIEQTQAAIEKYKAIKQGMLHDLFTRGLTASGQLRPTPQQAPELYKQSELGLIPKEWEVKRLEEMDIEIIDGDRGVNYPKSNDFTHDGYCLFLSATNVTKNGFLFINKQFICKEKDILLGTGKLQRNDIVLTTRGTVGNMAFYTDLIEFENLRINSGMVILRNMQNDINSTFLYLSIKEYIFGKEYRRVISGSAQPQLPIKDFKKFNILKPEAKEQTEITKRILSIDTKLQSEEALLSKYQSIKKGLMSDLLSGKREV